MQFFDSYEAYVASLPSGKGTARLAQSHWPPAEELGLDRWRVFLSAVHFDILSHSTRQHPYPPTPSGYGRFLLSCIGAQTIKGIAKV